MVRWIILLTLILGALLTTTPQVLEELMRSVISVYLIISGFAVLFFQRRAWEFLRPLFVLGLALVLLPPLFRNLARDLQSTLGYPGLSIGWGWLWALAVAVIVFILFHLIVWYWGRPRPARQHIHRERERVMPNLDLWDGPEE